MRQVEALGMAGRLDELTANARCVLLVMALNAHDTGTRTLPARTYFRGWPHLAHVALGRPTYTDTDMRAVARAVDELVRHGLIKPTGRRRGIRHAPAQYEITALL